MTVFITAMLKKSIFAMNHGNKNVTCAYLELTIQARLATNSGSSCLSLPTVGRVGGCHHTQLRSDYPLCECPLCVLHWRPSSPAHTVHTEVGVLPFPVSRREAEAVDESETLPPSK